MPRTKNPAKELHHDLLFFCEDYLKKYPKQTAAHGHQENVRYCQNLLERLDSTQLNGEEESIQFKRDLIIILGDVNKKLRQKHNTHGLRLFSLFVSVGTLQKIDGGTFKCQVEDALCGLLGKSAYSTRLANPGAEVSPLESTKRGEIAKYLNLSVKDQETRIKEILAQDPHPVTILSTLTKYVPSTHIIEMTSIASSSSSGSGSSSSSGSEEESTAPQFGRT